MQQPTIPIRVPRAEGCFRDSKYDSDDSDYKLHCKDAALYLRYYANEDRKATSQFIDQLKSLSQIDKQTNMRTKNWNLCMNTVDKERAIDDDEVKFVKKLDKQSELLARIQFVLVKMGNDTHTEQHHCMTDFAAKKMNKESSFLHIKTWLRWINGSKKSDRRKNHRAWDVIKEFLIKFDEEDKNNGNSTEIKMIELDRCYLKLMSKLIYMIPR